MDKVRELETKLNEIVARFDSLEEIGFDDLNAAWKEIDEVKQGANTLVEDLLVGSTRQENGKFKSRSDIEFDVHEIAELTSNVDKLTDRAYSEIHRISIEERHKKDLFFEKGKRRNEVRQSIRTNSSMIASLEAEIKSLKTQLGDPGLTDEMIADLASRGIKFTPNPSNLSPEKQYYLENELKAKEASLQSFKDANEMYKIEEERLTTEMGILKHGGKLEEPSLEQTPTEPERTEEEPTVEPIEPTVEHETPEEPERTEGEPEVTPVPFPVGPETPTEPERTEGEPVVTPVPFPVGPETPTEPERTGEEPEVTPVPFPGGGEELPVEPEEEEPTVEETPEPEQEEEEEEYEPTPAPLPLWKKVTLGLMTAATVFLGAIGVHTGIMAHNQNRMADSLEHIAMVDVDNQEPDQDEDPKNEPDDDKDKDQDQGKNPSSGDKDVNPGSPSTEPTNPGTTNPDPVTPNPEPTNPEPTNPEPSNPEPTNPEPSNPEPSNPEPTNPEPSNPEPSNPDPGQSDYEKENGLPAHLDEGEVIYDESTGISVNDKGETYQENKDGSLSYLGDQNLDKSNSGSSIVSEDELNPSIPQNPPITGEEKTAEEAGLTEGERDALQDALDGISGEDALDEKVSNAHSTPATGEDYTQAQEQSELDRQTDADIANFFSNNGIFDALNDGQALMR